MLPQSEDRRRLWITCCAAALLHLVVLFGVHISNEPASPVSLEVTLLAIPGSQTPLAAKVLAPVASTGGGAQRELRATARSGGPFELAGLRHAADLAMRAASRPGAIDILSSESGRQRSLDSGETTSRPGHDPALQLQRHEQAGDALHDNEPYVTRQAASDDQTARNAGITARASQQAAYRELWRQRIERAGSANFPWAALTTGQPRSLTLLVTVRADGRVADTRVLRSSGLPPLDRAALDILRAASPFPPFPDELRRTSAELGFVYDWEFLPGERAALRVGR